MNHSTRIVIAGLLTLTTLSMVSAIAQQQEREPAYRDFDLVQRLRVVCEHKHFGRVLDLIADVPSGKIVSAVVNMTTDAGDQTVVVPFGLLQYEAQGNLFRLESCLDDEQRHPDFDATKVKLTEQQLDDGTVEVTGSILVSRIADCSVQLADQASARVQGATIEVSGGHVAFAHVAATKERAGDQELHPTPWSALSCLAPKKDAEPNAPALRLAMSAPQLRLTPSLIAIILQDALYRPLVYKAFAVPPPAYDRG